MNNGLSAHQVEQLLNSTRNGKTYSKNLNLSSYMINYLLEDSNNEKIIIAYVNKLLKSSWDDDEVYIYLTNIISGISTESLYENILFWMQTIADHSKEAINSKRFMLMSTLIQIGTHNQDFNKLMLSKLLYQLLEECSSVYIESAYAERALGCLATCLEAYPSSCGTKKGQIESYLLQFLCCKTENSGLVKKAALCFQKLQKTGVSGIDSINYRNNWKAAFEKLCVTFDFLYDGFFDDIEEFYKYEKLAVNPYALPELPKVISATEMMYLLESRLHHTSLFLRGMLENQYCCAKCIQPQYILDIITRVLTIHVCINDADSDTMFHFSTVLIRNQIVILYLLRSLMAVLGLNLIPFSTTILKLLIECLTKTEKCNCLKHVSEYKEAVYKALEFLVKTLRNCVSNSVHEKIINVIINDISPITADVSLNISNVSNKTTKKALNKAMITRIISNPTKTLHLENDIRNPLKSKENICYQSLCCLVTFFDNVYVCIDDNTLRLLYETVIQAILGYHNGKKIFPYTSEKIQLKLNQVLIAMLEYANTPSAISLLVNLLKSESMNKHKYTSNISNSLKFLAAICQPVCPSWEFKGKNSDDLDTTGQLAQIGYEAISNHLPENEISEIHDEDELDMSNNSFEQNELCENVPETTTNLTENVTCQTQSDANIKNSEEKTTEKVIHLNSSPSNIRENEVSVNERMVVTASADMENDCLQPAPKKIKVDESSDVNINGMLATFVDEVSTCIIHT